MVGVGDWLGVQQLITVRVLGPRHARCTAADGYGAGSLEPDTVNVGEPDSTRLQPATHRTPATSTPPGDKFVTRSSTTNPGGIDGVAVLFVNQDDTRAIAGTILVCPDAAAATATLNAALTSIDKFVTDGDPQPSPVGTGGTVNSGASSHGS